MNKHIIDIINEELSRMSEKEKHCFNAKHRYYELLEELEQDQIDDLCDELSVQKYPRECVDNQDYYDKNIEDELDTIYCNRSNLDIDDPNKW